MRFSVITVSYQNDLGLKKTLNSLLKFEKNLYELIIIDGGSKDKTLEIVKEYNNIIDKCISEPDKGIYDAMNKGLKQVKNKNNIVSFLNAGDIALQNYFEEPGKIFIKNKNTEFCYGGLILKGRKSETLYVPKLFSKKTEYLQKMPFAHPSLFTKKKIFLKIGKFNLNKKITADHEWCVRLIKSGLKGERFKNPVVKFQLGGSSLKLTAQLEVFKTAIFYDRNIFIAILFLIRQLIVMCFYAYKSKN